MSLNTLQHMYLASLDSGYLEINWTVCVSTQCSLDFIYPTQDHNTYKKCWYAKNKERARIYGQNYRKKNLDRIRRRDRERARKIAAKRHKENDYVTSLMTMSF
jgi:hypothetical protein